MVRKERNKIMKEISKGKYKKLDDLIEDSLVDTKIMANITSVKNDSQLNSPRNDRSIDKNLDFESSNNSTHSNLDNVKRKMEKDRNKKERDIKNMID